MSTLFSDKETGIFEAKFKYIAETTSVLLIKIHIEMVLMIVKKNLVKNGIKDR